MVQGSSLKKGINLRKAKSQNRKVDKSKTKKGAQVKLPKSNFRNEAIDDRSLSREIAKASEKNVAAKLLQGGGRVFTQDILLKAKEVNRDLKRSQVKKKVGRVEEKLKVLEAAEEK